MMVKEVWYWWCTRRWTYWPIPNWYVYCIMSLFLISLLDTGSSVLLVVSLLIALNGLYIPYFYNYSKQSFVPEALYYMFYHNPKLEILKVLLFFALMFLMLDGSSIIGLSSVFNYVLFPVPMEGEWVPVYLGYFLIGILWGLLVISPWQYLFKMKDKTLTLVVLWMVFMVTFLAFFGKLEMLKLISESVTHLTPSTGDIINTISTISESKQEVILSQAIMHATHNSSPNTPFSNTTPVSVLPYDAFSGGYTDPYCTSSWGVTSPLISPDKIEVGTDIILEEPKLDNTQSSLDSGTTSSTMSLSNLVEQSGFTAGSPSHYDDHWASLLSEEPSSSSQQNTSMEGVEQIIMNSNESQQLMNTDSPSTSQDTNQPMAVARDRNYPFFIKMSDNTFVIDHNWEPSSKKEAQSYWKQLKGQEPLPSKKDWGMKEITDVAKDVKARHGDFNNPSAKKEVSDILLRKNMPSMYPSIVGEMLQPVPREFMVIPANTPPEMVEKAERYVTANENSVRKYGTHKQMLNKLARWTKTLS